MRGRSLPAAVLEPVPLHPFVRPWSTGLHWWVVSRLFGETPLAFHLVNLVLFAAILGLVFGLARFLGRGRGGALAAAFVGLHFSSEAAVRWASGSQDLWATLGALGAILAALHGRTLLSLALLLVACLSKETALVVPFVFLAIQAGRGVPWRDRLRAFALQGAVVAAWSVAWAIPFLAQWKAAGGSYVSFGAASLPAALLQFLRTACGLEGSPSTPFVPRAAQVTILVVTLVLVVAAFARERAERTRDEAWTPAWVFVAAAIAALPVAAVVSVWSGYQFLAAVCLAAVAAELTLARLPVRWSAVAGIAFALLLARGWGLQAFDVAVDPWKPLSRVNGAYLRRAEGLSASYLAELRALHPTVPARSVLFFAGLPPGAGWQSGNGAIVRWAYRDTTLRSHFLSELDAERVRDRPVFVFTAARGSLSEITGPQRFRDVAGGLLLGDHVEQARVALERAMEEAPSDPTARYMRAWIARADGDSAAAARWLRSAGLDPAAGPLPRMGTVRSLLAGGQPEEAVRLLTADLERHELDAEGHALLADVLAGHPEGRDFAVVEAYAARVLEPNDARAWKRWGILQAGARQRARALVSLRRARALGGAAADPELDRMIAELGGAARPAGE